MSGPNDIPTERHDDKTAAEFVPAHNTSGNELWLDSSNQVRHMFIGAVEPELGWRRLGYMQPVEHLDLLDCDGDTWMWEGNGYYLAGIGPLTRAEVEEDYGPVREATS